MISASVPVENHPCFSVSAKGKFGRIHLPVAPKCNIQCNYCSRKTDCANESRPGVTSKVLSPEQATDYLLQVLKAEPRISTVGIAGPGDPFANTQATLETCRLIREMAPEMILCLSSNGLGLDDEAVAGIAEVGVSHMTITINAVDPEIGAKVYAWVRDGKKTWRGVEGARVLMNRQLDAIVALKGRGITVKINTVVVPGVNDHHVGEIARVVASLGADTHNLIAMTPVEDTPFENLHEPGPNEMLAARRLSAPHIEQMTHCSRCRADAVGMLGEDRSAEFASCLSACATKPSAKVAARPRVAVATMEGVLVNQHLGVADILKIYEQKDGGYALVEERPCPAGGTGGRWEALAAALPDCRAVLVAAAGEAPRKALEEAGVVALEMEGLIEDCLEAVYNGGDLTALKARRNGLGSSCGCGKIREPGTGCG